MLYIRYTDVLHLTYSVTPDAGHLPEISVDLVFNFFLRFLAGRIHGLSALVFFFTFFFKLDSEL